MFKKFKLKDIFGIDPIRGARLIKEKRIPGNIPLVTAGEQNEGIAEYISNTENQTLQNMLTIDMFGNCFYRDYPYKSDDNILSFGLKGKSKEEMLYIAAVINSTIRHKYSYGKQYRKGSYLETIIKLPVIENPSPDHEYTADDIDWQYMRDRIETIERDCIQELDAYLQATGLNDYELTMDEEMALRGFFDGGVSFRKFKIGELFTSESGNVDIQKKNINGVGVPVISSGIGNRGVIGNSDVDAKIINNSSITVDMFGNVFYRDDPYKMVTHARVFALLPLQFSLDRQLGEFFEAQISKACTGYDYNNMCSFAKIRDKEINIPVNPDGSINFAYIYIYIYQQWKKR